VPHTARPMNIEVALSNSFGFGGTNGSLVFRRLR
jgi:3-oxoacyl-[acyl-carrier-protein] synthase II